jgi:hypothetical protein
MKESPGAKLTFRCWRLPQTGTRGWGAKSAVVAMPTNTSSACRTNCRERAHAHSNRPTCLTPARYKPRGSCLFSSTHSRSRGACRPSFALNFLTLLIRGRRECRAPDAPAAARAMIVVERTRVSQVTPESPGIPRAMVLRFPSCSPRRSGSFATVTGGIASTDLTPASRCQDHTTSPSASASPVSRAKASTAAHPYVRDVRETPLRVERDAMDID